MKYSLMSFMMNNELAAEKPNFLHLAMARSVGMTDENPTVGEVIAYLRAHGFRIVNGSMSFEELIRFAAEAGFDGVDMMDFHLLLPAAETKRILAQYGVVLSSLTMILPFVNAVTDESFDALLRQAKGAIDYVVEAGALNVMLVPSAYAVDAGITRERAFCNIVRGMKACADYAAERGIPLSTETLESIAVPYGSCGEMKRIFDTVPSLRFTHDTGNPLPMLENTIEVYEMFRERVTALHFKDCRYTREKTMLLCADGRYLESTILGEGIVDFSKQLALLKRDGFDGYITIEGTVPAEDAVSGARKSLAYFRALEEKLNA